MTLWLITARSGSKGIPNKNIKSLCEDVVVMEHFNHSAKSAGVEG
jgi:CMP-N-acetylneuraminic acid synthetase